MSASQGRKTIFITGAASGIGRATALHFARKGWFCGLTDIDEAGLAETGRQIGGGGWWSGRLDVRDRHGWADAVSAFADQTGGRMHVLFNNAGIGRAGWFEEVAPEDNDLLVDINLKGVLNGIGAAMPLLEKTPGARIVNVASTAGFVAAPRLAVYSATKFAVRALSEALDLEMRPRGIRVACLCPWFVDTPILRMGAAEGANHTLADDLRAGGQAIYPVELAAERAWDAAHGDQVIYMAGKAAERARFMARFLPGRLAKAIAAGLPRR